MISVTRARVRRRIDRVSFLLLSFRIGVQARRADGNLGVKLLWDRHGTYWTCTSWESEQAMRAFLTVGLHGRVTRKLARWCDEAAFVHWKQRDSASPSWEEAHRRLQTEGRTSSLDHPSEAHLRGAITAPAVRFFHHVCLK